ncbi:lipopolysaccharide biosynthesis protein [Anaeromyxobacter terrae]|uniref:lipopolysaccharide biosynthesis protein n=1 Tax=Anaeromyxobacter terrae TaxID=2925406 RepID=UPI001F57A3F8|nr:lipopolysaccharide biosynthesis protein [Anaeromyxobacter sp. SG22]
MRPFDSDSAHGRSQERYRRIALTTISSLAVRGVGTLTGLITVPLVLGYLGKERFGLWSTITTVIAWATLFDLGIANGLVNCISRAHGRDEREEAARYVSTAFAALLAIAALLGLALMAGAGHVPWSALLAVRGAVDDRTVTWSVVAALGAFILGLPLSIVPQIYAGYQRAYAANVFTMVGMLAGFAAVVIAVHSSSSMPIIIAALGAGGLVSSALGLLYALRVGMPWLRFRASAVSKEALRALADRSIPIFLFQIGALAVNETQSIVLAHRCDLAAVADYSIFMRLYVLALGLIQMSTASFVPSFREARERGDEAWMRAAFRRFVQLRLVLAVCGGTALAVVGNDLLRLWLRRSDIRFQPELWICLVVVMVAVTWATAHSDLLSILDRLWVLVALVALNGAVTVALTYLLAPSLRVLGVVLAYGAVTVLVYSWLLPWLTLRIRRGNA